MVTPSLPCGDHAVTALPAAQAAVAVATIEGLHNDLATARAHAAELEVGMLALHFRSSTACPAHEEARRVSF
jgi:hypothetical protein